MKRNSTSIQWKAFMAQKLLFKKVKREVTELGEIFADHISHNVLVSWIYKEFKDPIIKIKVS